MKFLCLECDLPMDHDARIEPGDGSVVAEFACPQCGRRIAMLTNPMEAGFVQSLGDADVAPGQVRKPVQPPHDDHPANPPGSVAARPRWSDPGRERLAKVPRFVRAMVRKIYTDWAAERGIAEITPAVMDAARSDLGLEGM